MRLDERAYQGSLAQDHRRRGARLPPRSGATGTRNRGATVNGEPNSATRRRSCRRRTEGRRRTAPFPRRPRPTGAGARSVLLTDGCAGGGLMDGAAGGPPDGPCAARSRMRPGPGRTAAGRRPRRGARVSPLGRRRLDQRGSARAEPRPARRGSPGAHEGAVRRSRDRTRDQRAAARHARAGRPSSIRLTARPSSTSAANLSPDIPAAAPAETATLDLHPAHGRRQLPAGRGLHDPGRRAPGRNAGGPCRSRCTRSHRGGGCRWQIRTTSRARAPDRRLRLRARRADGPARAARAPARRGPALLRRHGARAVRHQGREDRARVSPARTPACSWRAASRWWWWPATRPARSRWTTCARCCRCRCWA